MLRTTTSSLLLAAALLLAWPAATFAAEGAVEKVAALERAISDPNAAWRAKWEAYHAAKGAIKEARGEDKAAAEARYRAIQGAVAVALRRDTLPVTGWLMGFFGAVVLWGGLAFCIGVARKKGGSGGQGAA
jgi:hypothetical protein